MKTAFLKIIRLLYGDSRGIVYIKNNDGTIQIMDSFDIVRRTPIAGVISSVKSNLRDMGYTNVEVEYDNDSKTHKELLLKDRLFKTLDDVDSKYNRHQQKNTDRLFNTYDLTSKESDILSRKIADDKIFYKDYTFNDSVKDATFMSDPDRNRKLLRKKKSHTKPKPKRKVCSCKKK
jgi:hypothetical protein